MGIKKFLSSPKRIAVAGLTGGISETGIFDKNKAEADPLAEQLKQDQAQYARAQKSAFNEIVAKSTPEAIQSQIGSENAALQSNLADIRRKIQQNIARQGLQGSSIGQSAMVNPERQVGRQISLNLASAPQRELEQAQKKFQLAGQALGGQQIPLNFNATQSPSMFSQLLPSLIGAGGTIGGAAFGGPVGAAAGGQVGSGLGSLAQQQMQQPAPYSGFGSSPYNRAYSQNTGLYRF